MIREEAISRMELIAKLEKIDRMYGSDFYWEVRKIVDKMQPVSSVGKTGRWIDVGEREPWYRCSECNEKVFGGYRHYCPNCGTKMQKKD
jgi:predicted RNA-binding Zn-ribbon protein involved in translation (DUF1610 family)